MKKTIILLAVLITSLTSCEKWNPFDKDKKEKPCAVVSSETLPLEVYTAFSTKYPGYTVETWFNKDNTGFCALFIFNGVKTFAQFNNDGSFVNEEVEKEGEHENKDSGCECEIED